MQGVGDDQLLLAAGQVVVAGEQQLRERLHGGSRVQHHGPGLGPFENLQRPVGDAALLRGGLALPGVHPLFPARGLVHRHRSAVHAAQPTLGLEHREVAAHGLHGDLEPSGQLGTVDTALPGHGAGDLLVAFCSEHLHLTDGE